MTPYESMMANLWNSPQPDQGKLQPLQPEEEESLLSKGSGLALSGLGYVGQTLGKPGRAVRGLLGGQGLDALKNLIPFSDTLGITDPANDISGHELLHKAGLTDAPQKGFEWGDIPGFALEMATDPLMYFNPLAPLAGGGLTATGQAAKKAGTLAPRLGQRIAQGEAGLFHAGIPFTGIGGAVGTGDLSQSIANKLGSIYDAGRWSGPSRTLASLFSEPMKGTTSEIAQRTLADLPNNDHLAREFAGRLAQEASPEERSMIPMIREKSLSPLPGTHIADLMERIDPYLDQMPAQAQAKGINQLTRPDYFPRQTEFGGAGGSAGNQLDPFNQHMIARDPAYEGLPRQFVNDLYSNPMVTGAERTLQKPPKAAAHIRDQYLKPLGWNEGEWLDLARRKGVQGDPEMQRLVAQIEAGGGDVPEVLNRQFRNMGQPQPLSEEELSRLTQLEGMRKQSDSLARKAAASPNVGPIFNQDPLMELMDRGVQHERSLAKADAIHDILAGAAVRQGPGMPNAFQALKMAGLEGSEAPNVLIDRLKALGKIPGDLETPEAAQHLLDMGIPQNVMSDVTHLTKGFQTPDAIQGPLGLVDSFTNLFKGANTLFPARLARNTGQEVFNSLIHGNNPMDMLPAYKLLRGGQTLEDANQISGLQHLDPAAASKELALEMFAHNVAGPSKLIQGADVAGPAGETLAQRSLIAPGDARSVMEGVQFGKSNLNPLNMRGVGGRQETTFAPGKLALNAEEAMDDVTRGGTYISLRKQGFSPEAAAAETLKTHYDYGNMAPFEKSIMRRVFPFWNWQKQNVPAVVNQLLENPGGPTAQAIHATTSLHQKQGFEPDRIAEGLAVPLGGEENGTQRYLSHLGLPFEDAFAIPGVGRGLTKDVSRTLMNVLGETNPLIKGPLEVGTGKQFYSGKDLADLSDKGLTGNMLLDQAIMNSPLTRFATTARTLADERKGPLAAATNLLSPARVTDVDMPKARSIAEREQLDELLRGSPNIRQHEEYYAKPEDRANLSPDQVQLLRLQKTMEARAKEQAKARQIGVAR